CCFLIQILAPGQMQAKAGLGVDVLRHGAPDRWRRLSRLREDRRGCKHDGRGQRTDACKPKLKVAHRSLPGRRDVRVYLPPAGAFNQPQRRYMLDRFPTSAPLRTYRIVMRADAQTQPPFAEFMGVKVTHVSRERVVAELTVRE